MEIMIERMISNELICKERDETGVEETSMKE